ncbi:UNVERIFIED_CONTAM: Subtilisin-like protease SBT4.3 [Sesamum radiatum]|uniref:Subtilisin-like protease SBT4.3 n=1 Tax=Sesamum radiatum TaxID=300843 RepID=A0AAW2MXS8_SESRA
MVYIVYLGGLAETDESPSSHHFHMLQQVVDSRFVNQSIVRSYTRSFNGFAANLTAQEKQELARHEDVVSIFPSRTFQPLTTRSWDFMGLPENVHRNLTVESDIIIGVLDTGIWPESESFNDEGFGPPPKKWKGVCEGGKNFTCNNKLIGARYYNSLQPSNDTARDREGHGTHTASTAAGNYVKDASFYGIAKGTARGGVPSARIAAYKVCGLIGCLEVDILAAFDDAIADGVDILSISLGPQKPLQFKDDSVAIGAFHALQKGVLVLQSAGNSGDYKTVASIVPWIFTVAASSTDRGIVTKVVIGNGTAFTGKAINSFSLAGSSVPVVYGKNVTKTCSEDDARQCLPICLEPSLVKGKIILCDNYLGVNDAFRVGAVGAVTSLNAFTPQGRHLVHISFIVPLAASHLSDQNFNDLQSYYAATITPKVDILTSESVKNIDAPLVADFSSRGPNGIIPDILKPDVTAPGIEILAAFSPLAPPSGFSSDKRSMNYSILSGTSMSCPHAAGAAAYVKSFHPNWSPSAIKSALMTTGVNFTWRMDPTKDSLAEFSYGAGHIDPVKAVDPGLVYETFTEDYINMLCSLGYDTATLRKILGVNSTCPTGMQITPKDLNYPSMARRITTNDSTVLTFSENFTRTVTNVGLGNSTYKVTTSTSPDYNISVKPDILSFRTLNERKSFEVIISGKITGEMVSAELEWSDGVHRVRSPIILYPDSL